MLEALLAGVKAHFAASGALTTAVGGRLHLGLGKFDLTAPYIILTVVGEETGGTFAGNTVYVVRLQFTVHSKAQSPLECVQIRDAVWTWLAAPSNNTFSVTGYQDAVAIPAGGSGPTRYDEYWQATRDYRVTLAET